MTLMIVGVGEVSRYLPSDISYLPRVSSHRIYTTYYIYIPIVSTQRISAKWVSTFWLRTVAPGHSLLGGPRTWFRIFMWVRHWAGEAGAGLGHLGIFSEPSTQLAL